MWDEASALWKGDFFFFFLFRKRSLSPLAFLWSSCRSASVGESRKHRSLMRLELSRTAWPWTQHHTVLSDEDTLLHPGRLMHLKRKYYIRHVESGDGCSRLALRSRCARGGPANPGKSRSDLSPPRVPSCFAAPLKRFLGNELVVGDG